MENRNYIVIDELPTDQRIPFWRWIFNQTRPIVEEGDAAYIYDYERWLDWWNGKKKHVKIFD